MKSKKMAIVGVTAGLLAGAGAGFVLNLPGGASAEKSISVQAAGSDTTTPGNSIGGTMGDGDGDHGMMGDGDFGQHVRDALQALVDDGTLTADDVEAIVAAIETKPANPPAPPTDGTQLDRSAIMANRLQSLVDEGTLSATQLDKVVAALSAAMPAGGGRGGHMGGGHMGGGHKGDGDMDGDHMRGGHGRMGGEMLATAATTIGITEDELKAELRAGKTIAEVAVANGKTAQQVIDALVEAASDNLTQHITDMVNGVEPAGPAAGAPPTTVAGA